jgi:addiction module RelB/DinJ family antitoxin
MKTVLNVKTDTDLKKQAQRLADELGLPLSTVVSGYLREFIQNREITFSNAPRMSPWLEKIIGEFEYDYARGKNLSPKFGSAKAMFAHLKQAK